MLNTAQENKPPTTTVKPQFDFQDYFKKSRKGFYKPVILFDSIHWKMTELRGRMEPEFYFGFSWDQSFTSPCHFNTLGRKKTSLTNIQRLALLWVSLQLVVVNRHFSL